MSDVKRADKAERGHAPSRFAEQAEEEPPGLVREFWAFLRYNKKWWLTPIILALLLIAGLVLLSGTGAAPLIYTLW